MFNNLPKTVKIVEVGPRDGLQNESKTLSTSNKLKLINALVDSGIKNIEITSFVSPQWIPQLADAADLCKSLKLPRDINTSALVPNSKGYERAKDTDLSSIAIFMSATESHNKKNINRSIAESLKTFEELVPLAKNNGKKVRAYLSVVFVCPYEGITDQDKVVNICKKLLDIGVDELSLGDTIGAATPKMVLSLVDKLKKIDSLEKFALHFHDTEGMALVNTIAGLEAGITIFDASIGGMGGCPYAPGAAGNLATEDLVHLLHSLDIATGIDLDKLIACGALAQQLLGKQLPGRFLRASLAKKIK
jgi:hydroxymethylglutaryl-CoA lyase